MSYFHLRFIAVAAVILFVISAAQAQKSGSKDRDKSQDERPQAPAAIDRTASVEAQKKITEAQATIAKAEAEARTSQQKMQQEFETSEEWISAQAAVKEAQNKLQTASRPILEALYANPEYKSAHLKKQQMEDKLRALEGKTSAINERTIAANSLMELRGVLSKMEADSLAAEPRVAQARANLVEASQAAGQLQSTFEESLKNNPQWLAAKEQAEQSRQELKSAQDALAAARQQEIAMARQQTEEARRQREGSQQTQGKKKGKGGK